MTAQPVTVTNVPAAVYTNGCVHGIWILPLIQLILNWLLLALISCCLMTDYNYATSLLSYLNPCR